MNILPSRAVGPVRLGAPIGVAVRGLLQIDGARMVESGNSYGVVLGDGLVVMLEASRVTHLVRSVEVYGDLRTEPITLGGFSLLGDPADEILQGLTKHYDVRVEDSGQFAVMDDLLVALWRPCVPEGPSDVEGKYFESVLVALPGYYENEDCLAEMLGSGDESQMVGRVDPGSDDTLV